MSEARGGDAAVTGTDRLTPKDGRWLAVGEWVVEFCAEQPDEPESLFIVHPDVCAANVARLHNDLLDEVERLAAENERLRTDRDQYALCSYDATQRARDLRDKLPLSVRLTDRGVVIAELAVQYQDDGPPRVHVTPQIRAALGAES